jgi:hypothetical protein
MRKEKHEQVGGGKLIKVQEEKVEEVDKNKHKEE